MAVAFPISFEQFPKKKQINLNVLRRCFSPAVLDYTLCIPEVSIYRKANGKDWARLQISGPLFLLEVNGSDDPIVFLMNNQVFVNTQDYHMRVPKETERVVENNKLYLKMDDSTFVLIATDSDEDARRLAAAIEAFEPKIDERMPVYVPEVSVKGGIDDDPTISHVLRSLE